MAGTVHERLKECLVTGSKADKALASYILAQLNTIPFETAASLGAKVSVSEPTVGRFCRTLGYKSFKDFKDALRGDIGDRPWLIADRLRDFQARMLTGGDQMAQGLQLEIAGLVAVYEQAQSEEWRRAVRRVAAASSVHVAGFQTERGIAQYFAHQLQYLRDRVHVLDLAGGNFSELLLTDTTDACLVMFEARRYSRMAPLLAREARAAGVPVILVTDAFCDWGRDLVDEMFVVSTEFNMFWDSTAHMANLVALLMNAIFIELGPGVEARMNRLSELYSGFTGYVGDPSGPVR